MLKYRGQAMPNRAIGHCPPERCRIVQCGEKSFGGKTHSRTYSKPENGERALYWAKSLATHGHGSWRSVSFSLVMPDIFAR